MHVLDSQIFSGTTCSKTGKCSGGAAAGPSARRKAKRTVLASFDSVRLYLTGESWALSEETPCSKGSDLHAEGLWGLNGVNSQGSRFRGHWECGFASPMLLGCAPESQLEYNFGLDPATATFKHQPPPARKKTKHASEKPEKLSNGTCAAVPALSANGLSSRAARLARSRRDTLRFSLGTV